MPDDRRILTNYLMRDKRTQRAMCTHSVPRPTRQLPVSSVQSRIDGQHSGVTYYQECEVELVTDEELAELCRLAAEQTINMASDKLIDYIDSLDASESGRVFM